MNNRFIMSLCMGLLLAMGTSNAMDKKNFSKDSYARVVSGPESLRGRVVKIIGTTKDVWGIDDVDGSTESFGVGVLIKYLTTDHPDNGGKVYYVRPIDSPIKDCVHESWITPESNFSEDDEIVEWEWVAAPGGELVQKTITRGESRKKYEKMVSEKKNDFESFQKEYVDRYFPAVSDCKSSLIEHAPKDLKQWFATIKQGGKPNLLLLYGAYGVGKTMTAEALTQDAGARLCYLYSHATMRWDYRIDPFNFDYLDQLGQDPICVVVDSIERLADDDIENMKRLADHCSAKKNLHLLAIAYYAKKNMPPDLYAKFQPLKYPMPDQETKLALIKRDLKEHGIETTVDDAYLNEYLSRVPDCTPREIEGLMLSATLSFRHRDRVSKPIKFTKEDFENALEKSKEDAEELEIIFEECE